MSRLIICFYCSQQSVETCHFLGSGESGKSTIVKQMKIIHQNGFTGDELLQFRTTIWKNVIDSAQAIILHMRKLGIDCVTPANRPNADRIIDYKVESRADFAFSPEIAEAIAQLWQDPIMAKVLDHSSDFYLMDSAS